MGTFVFLIIFFTLILPRIKEAKNNTYSTRSKNVWQAKAHYERNGYNAYQYQANEENIPDMKPAKKITKSDPIFKKWVLSLVSGIGGAVGTAVFGGAAFSSFSDFFWTITHGFFFMDELVVPVMLGAATFGCFKLSQYGFQAMNRIKRFRLYNSIIDGKEVCPVADIARSSGRNKKDVLEDMQDMVRHGYFPQGFVDEKTMSYYADNEAWRSMNPERAKEEDEPLRKPRKRKTQAEKKKTEQTKKKAKESDLQKEENEQEDNEAKEMSEVERDMRSLQAEIKQIENESIKTKAKRLYEHSCDILAWVKLHPECEEDVRRFCSYYLPTATKLLKTYNEVAPHADESRVAASIQDEVSHILDTMIEAFRGLMDNLLQNTAVDMQAEISALETVLTQEGLVANGFTMPQTGAAEKSAR